MNKRLVVFALLIPLATSAQAPPLLRAPGAASPPAGITVSGRGFARVPVKTLQFVAYARGAAQDDAVLTAMRSAGIDDPSIGPAGPQISLSANGFAALRGAIRDATRAKLERIALAASDFIRSHPGTSIDNVQFSARYEDCAALEQTARAAALADARRKAEAIATSAGVVLDAVTSVTEGGGCVQPASTFDAGAGPQVDVVTLTANLGVFETVTYGISPADASRRRRPL